MGVQPVEEAFVLTPLLDVLQPHAPGQDVVGDVEHVIALMVGQVDLEQLQVAINLLHQPQAPHQQMNGSDAAAVDGRGAAARFVAKVAPLEHGPGPLRPVPGCQAALDSTLAVAQCSCVFLTHSK